MTRVVAKDNAELAEAAEALHGLVENGGLAHAVCVDEGLTRDAIDAHRLAGNGVVADVIARAQAVAQTGDETDAVEHELDELGDTYYRQINSGALSNLDELDPQPTPPAVPDVIEEQLRAWRDLVILAAETPEIQVRKRNRLLDRSRDVSKRLIATPAGCTALERLVTDPDEDVRLTAAVVLFRTGSTQARDYLEALAQTDGYGALTAQAVLGVL